MAEPFLGQIIMFAGNFPIRGYAFCNGQTLAINQNTALFSILGTIYGGDGRTTFRLPELRGRIPLHIGGSSSAGPGLPTYSIGQSSGTYTHTLTTAEMPPHQHTVSMPATGQDATNDDPSDHFLAVNEENIYHSTPEAGVTLGTFNSGSVGSAQAFSVQNPFLGLNFMIALAGIFPSRS